MVYYPYKNRVAIGETGGNQSVVDSQAASALIQAPPRFFLC